MRNLATVLVTDKESGQSAEVKLDELTNLTNSVVMLSVGPDEIASIEAQSGDLLITLNSGEAIIIAGFFETPEGERNELVLEDANGILWWGQYDSPWSEFSFAEINLLDEAAKDQEIGWWLIAAGLGGAAAIAAAAGGGSSGGSSPSTPEDSEPDPAPVGPDAPIVNSVTNNFDDQGTPTGTTVSGETDPGNSVEIRDGDGNVVGSGEADDDGNFEIITDEPLADGEEYDVVAIDEDGNVSDPTPITGDLTPPNVTVEDLVTNEVAPELSGTIDDPDATVEVTIGDATHEATNNGDGTWSLTWPAALDEDNYTVEVEATDPAGNTGTAQGDLTIDTTAPEVTVEDLVTNEVAPELSGTIDDPDATVEVTIGDATHEATNNGDGTWSLTWPAALDEDDYTVEVEATDPAGNTGTAQGDLTIDTTAPEVTVEDLVTNEVAPELSGTIDDPDATVEVTIGDATHEATNNGDGTWSLTWPAALDEDDYTVEVEATDPAGNTGTAQGDLTIDTTAPEVTVEDLVTNEVAPELSGTIDDPDATVEVTIGDATHEATNNGDGTWSLTWPAALDEDDYTVEVEATDPAGNTGTAQGDLTIDTTAPEVTVEDLVTNEVAPELSGTIDDPDATVEVTIGDATHEATNNGDGTWSLTWPAALDEDDYTVEVEATDPAGNTGTAQGDLTIDTTAPEVTVEDLVTNEVAPELSGTIDDPDATVEVTIGDATHEATNNGDGTWSLTWPAALDEDDYTVEVEATDPAGNTGTAQGDLTIDTTAPEVTVEDLVTNEVAPELSGTIDDPDATVEVTIGDATHEATNNGDGTWSLTWPAALDEDDYTVEVEATDPAGNTGTAQGDLTIDTTAPEVTVEDLVTNEVAPELSGTIDDPDATVEVTIGDATHEATNNGDGTWSLTWPAALDEDDYTVEVEATDPAGNTGTAQGDLTIDTTAPEVTVEDLVTNEVVPELSGTIDDPDATVEVTIGDATHEATNNGDGTWSLTWPAALDEDDYTVEVEATDPAGNTGTAQGDLTIDTTAPDAPVITGAVDDVEPAGDLADGDVTNDSTPTLAGTAEADSTVTLFQDSVEIGTTTADAGGNWSFEVPALEDDTFTFTATATDAAGNVSSDSTGFTLTIDTVAPDAPTLELANDTGDVDGVTSDGTVNVGGLEENATWEYSTDGGATWTEGTGTSFELPEGDYADGDVLARQTDEAGNTSDNGELGAVSVDTTSPGGEDGTDAPVLVIADASDGFINAEQAEGGIQAVVELTEGTQEGDTVTVTLSDADGTEHEFTYTVTAGDIAAGEAALTLEGDFAEGAASAVAVITDEAGNRSADSNSVAFEIDTVAPDAPILELDNDTGDVDGVTSDGTVNVGGLEENATWEYSTDGGATWTEGEGTSFVLPEGEYAEGDVLARQTDEAGNTSGNGALGAVSVDTTSPGGEDGSDAPVLAIAEADDGFINADELADGIQAVVTLTEGTQEGDTVTVTLTDADGIDHEFTHTVTAAEVTAGEVELDLDGDFAEGAASAVAVITDEAGNRSADSNVVDFTIDTTSPGGDDGTDAPVLVIADASDGFINAEQAEGGIQAVVTLTEGTQEGDTVTVTLTDADGIDHEFTHTVTAAEVTAGEVELDLDGDFAEGAASAVAVITDEAGNRSADSNSVAFEIDTQAPDAPTLVLANDTGDVDGVTSDGTVNVGGLEENATWEYSTDGGDTWLPGSGDSFVLLDGDYADGDVLARQTDEAGNTSVEGTLEMGVTVDGSTPTITIDTIAGDDVLNLAESQDDLTITGSTTGVENGQVVTVTLAGETYTGEVINNAWSVTVPSDDLEDLNDGEAYTVTADVENAAGTPAEQASRDFTIDMTPPDAPTADFNDVGDAISGEAEPGSTVTVYDEDDNVLGTAEADADTGEYTVVLDEPLIDGEEVTVTATDAAGNESDPTAATAPQAPPALTLTLANDTGTDGDGITSDGTVEVEGLVADATWEYSLDGGENWIEGDGESFELPADNYADGTVIARQTVGALTSPEGALGAVEIVELNAVDDAAELDMGEQSVTVYPSETEENVQVLGVAEGEGGELSGTTFTVAEGQTGEVALQIQQTALVAVADAFRVEVYDADDNLVYVGGTDDSLVGDVGGLEILGLTGDDTLIAVLTDLAPGEYSVVVRNEQSALEGLLDTDGEGVSLQELGDAGVVLGPDNQEVILDAVEDGLNDYLLAEGLDLGLGSGVRALLEPLLGTVDGLGVGEVVGVLSDVLNTLGLSAALDTVVDTLAETLLSNTLTAFQFTDITTSLTEYSFAANQPVEGNVITGEGEGNEADQLVPGSEVSQVQLLDAEGNPSGDPIMVPESGSVEVAGLYGVLTIAADGSYSYTANGDRGSLGESDTFIYTVSDGLNETTASLTIEIDGEALPELNAQPDSVDLDMGNQSAVVNAPQTESNVQVLGLLEGDSGEISGVPFTVSEDQLGEMTIQVSQTALVAVADAFVIEVVDAAGNVVFAAATPDNPLVGDVAGINLLGVTGDDTLTVTATGLPPGDYTVVVRNDQGELADLLTGFSVQELGEAGVILGPENQELVLDAVDDALGGNVLSGTVRGILELTLNTLNGLGVDRLVDVLTDTLTVLGLGGLVDGVLDAVAGALVSNTLTLLQSTEVTTTLTEYAFDGDLAFSGNVITGEGDGNVEDGIAQGGVVTRVENADGEVVEVLGSGSEGVTIAGLYGVLTIFEDGSYSYDATGARAGLGQEEVFTYTVTNGAFNPDGSRVTSETTLTINIDGQGTAGDIAFAGVEYDFATEPGVDWDNEIGFSWLLGALGVTLWTRQDPTSRTIEVEENTTQDLTINVTGGDLLSVGGNTSVTLEKWVDGSWEVERSFNNDQLVGLLGLGSGGEFVVTGITAGEYRVTMEVGTGLLGLPGSIRADISSTVTLLDEFKVDNVATAEGNLLENDVLRGEEFELSVSLDGETFESTSEGAVTLDGEYGTLVVEADGSYVYTPYDLENFVDTLSDTFTYQVAYEGGPTETAELTVFVRSTNPANELFVIDSDEFDPIDGEGGFDVLLLDGEFDLDFTDPDTATVANIERIDLGEADGENTLTLAGDDLIALTDDNDVLQITGDEEDTVVLSGDDWSQGETQVINGVAYTEYTFGDDATLLVQDGVNVEGA
ncbi:BapA/Bap/LapF family large adhesin [Halomonas mongoliensis]|uniref:BapA/Bap/LapF family large adhesin n=1 Tax=Halomonas mongoliensis TaxID=321265 RepID=UPI00403B0D79